MQNNIFNSNRNIDIHNPYHFFKKSYCSGLTLVEKKNNVTDLFQTSTPNEESQLKFKRRNISLIPLR